MIVGVGVDVVPVERFRQALTRTPRLALRLFNADERVTAAGRPRQVSSLAVRFAAKEAIAKALGAPPGMRWHDAEIVSAESGEPRVDVRGTVAARAAQLGVVRWHVSLSHDGGLAVAMIVAESA